jgi:hypothetical protein
MNKTRRYGRCWQFWDGLKHLSQPGFLRNALGRKSVDGMVS